MFEVDVLDVVRKEALKDAQRICNEGGTVGLACDNKRRSLARLSADPSLDYYQKGHLCYSVYVEVLVTEIDRIYASHGKRLSCAIPAYAEDTNVSIA